MPKLTGLSGLYVYKYLFVCSDTPSFLVLHPRLNISSSLQRYSSRFVNFAGSGSSNRDGVDAVIYDS